MKATILNIHTDRDHREEFQSAIYLRIKHDSPEQKQAIQSLYDLLDSDVIVHVESASYTGNENSDGGGSDDHMEGTHHCEDGKER